MEIYSSNKRKNKQLALAILSILFLQNIGLLPALGLDLSRMGIANFTIATLLGTLGLLWILYGLMKYKIM
jgi:uncharacterized membrane protein